jgi:hypothetical protein
MRSPPGSITATRHLIVKRAMTPARSRKPNPRVLRPTSPRAGAQQVSPHSPVQQRCTPHTRAGAGAAGRCHYGPEEGVILTLVTFRGARDSRLHVSVWGQPYTERYCFRPAEIPRPEIPARFRPGLRAGRERYLRPPGRAGALPGEADFDREDGTRLRLPVAADGEAVCR